MFNFACTTVNSKYYLEKKMKLSELQVILEEYSLKTCQKRISMYKAEVKSSSQNSVTFPSKSMGITKLTIRDNSRKETIVQESKKTTVKKVDTKEKDLKKIDFKKGCKKVNSNDKVSNIIDSKISATKYFNKIDTSTVDLVVLKKRMSNTKTMLMEVTYSINVAKGKAEKRGGVLKKLSSVIFTTKNKYLLPKKH